MVKRGICCGFLFGVYFNFHCKEMLLLIKFFCLLKVSAKRGTGVCARVMCGNPSLDRKNICEVHQQERDSKNAEVSHIWV
jgi:hypothetical protein